MSGTPRRMDDEAIARLEDLLERHAVPHEGMSLEMLDGFLSALVVGPGPVAAEEYQQLIWNREPQWTWVDDRREAEALIERLRDDVLWRVTRDLPDDSDLSPQAAAELDAVNPLMAMPDEADGLADGDDPFANVDPAFPLAAEWAHGFLTAVALREDEWRSWANDEEQIDEDLGDLMRLALVDPEQATAMGIEDGGIPDFSERMEMVAVLPYMLQDIHLFRMERLRPSPVVRAPVPGRNDPCPCGSGEKFKKCCGAPGRLN